MKRPTLQADSAEVGKIDMVGLTSFKASTFSFYDHLIHTITCKLFVNWMYFRLLNFRTRTTCMN